MELPEDPMMLFSVINMKLRDCYASLDELCEDMNISKDILIGYQFPDKWMKAIHFKELRIYASVQNALTISKMKGGWDPEYNADGSGRAYPVARVWSLGLNVKF